MPLSLQAIHRYPVKSCRGDAVPDAVVEPWGLAGDRRWMIVDRDADVITARKYPRLLLAHPRLREQGLMLTAPGLPDLAVAIPDADRLVAVRVWSSEVLASAASDEAHAWFSTVIGAPARLVYLDDPTRRRVNPGFADDGDRVSFADGYPLLVTTTASLDALNDLIAAGPRAAEGPLPMLRFRPNVVVDGGQAWAEDGWRRLRIGAATFRAVKGCERCAMTMVDPQTAHKGKEPIATLARHRRFGGTTWFGMNLIPDVLSSADATISVGDRVEVLEAVPAPDGPPR